MIIGTVKEIKRHEYRVGLTPESVAAYVRGGHSVLVEHNAGIGAGYSDEEYRIAGAEIVDHNRTVFEKADMVVKVKEPQPEEYDLLKPNQILYTYFHFAASRSLTEAMMKQKIRAVAYETIKGDTGGLPCLKPMSEIAGRMSVQEGAKYLERPFGGRGVLLGGVPGATAGNVAIFGGGVVGFNACQIAVGMRADVTVLDVNVDRLEYIDTVFHGKVNTLLSTDTNVEKAIIESDLIIGAVLIPGGRAPQLVAASDLSKMKTGAVIVDVAVDQGGCFETTKPTTHDEPTYIIDGVVHYCVANMPGAVSRTATGALNNATTPLGLQIANKGLERAASESMSIRTGINLYDGHCVNEPVAREFRIPFSQIEEYLD